MSRPKKDLRQFPSAYEARQYLPDLARLLTPEELKLIPIWKGRRFRRGIMYLDLDNLKRGPFVASGDEGIPEDYTYTCRTRVPEEIWAKLASFAQAAAAGAKSAGQDRSVSVAS